MTAEQQLINAGCEKQGFILIPPTKKVVPVDIRRIKIWNQERIDNYIKDIKNADKN